VPKLRERLQGFGTFALFTRAGGHGDDLDPDTIERYFKTGGTAAATEPPLLMTWPDTLRRLGPLLPGEQPPP
jgi:hypothetical protein